MLTEHKIIIVLSALDLLYRDIIYMDISINAIKTTLLLLKMKNKFSIKFLKVLIIIMNISLIIMTVKRALQKSLTSSANKKIIK